MIHNFQLLSTELASKDAQISQFVNSSNAVFQHFANQDANIRATLRLLPGTLQETQLALGKVLRRPTIFPAPARVLRAAQVRASEDRPLREARGGAPPSRAQTEPWWCHP